MLNTPLNGVEWAHGNFSNHDSNISQPNEPLSACVQYCLLNFSKPSMPKILQVY